MKKTQLLLFAIFGIAFTTLLMSCAKDTDQAAEDIITSSAKGSINLKAGGNTYNKLFSSVVYSKSDTMVSFWGINFDTEDSFIVSFGTVPEVGKTKQVNITTDQGILFLIQGSMLQGGLFTGQSGTIKRVSTDKYEIDVEMSNSQDQSNLINISGTVTVGESK